MSQFLPEDRVLWFWGQIWCGRPCVSSFGSVNWEVSDFVCVAVFVLGFRLLGGHLLIPNWRFLISRLLFSKGSIGLRELREVSKILFSRRISSDKSAWIEPLFSSLMPVLVSTRSLMIGKLMEIPNLHISSKTAKSSKATKIAVPITKTIVR